MTLLLVFVTVALFSVFLLHAAMTAEPSSPQPLTVARQPSTEETPQQCTSLLPHEYRLRKTEHELYSIVLDSLQFTGERDHRAEKSRNRILTKIFENSKVKIEDVDIHQTWAPLGPKLVRLNNQ